MRTQTKPCEGVDRAARCPAPAPAASSSTSPRQRILVVDDDRIVAVTVDLILSSTYDVTVASSVTEALEQLRASAFDLILCDVVMPGRSGLALYDELARTTYAGPIIFMSGGSLPARTQASLQSTGAPMLAKPFFVADLEALVAGLLLRATGSEGW